MSVSACHSSQLRCYIRPSSCSKPSSLHQQDQVSQQLSAQRRRPILWTVSRISRSSAAWSDWWLVWDRWWFCWCGLWLQANEGWAKYHAKLWPRDHIMAMSWLRRNFSWSVSNSMEFRLISDIACIRLRIKRNFPVAVWNADSFCNSTFLYNFSWLYTNDRQTSCLYKIWG